MDVFIVFDGWVCSVYFMVDCVDVVWVCDLLVIYFEIVGVLVVLVYVFEVFEEFEFWLMLEI